MRHINREREDRPQLAALCLAQADTAGAHIERLLSLGVVSNQVMLLTFGG